LFYAKIISTLVGQAKKLTFTSRVFYHSQLGLSEKSVTQYYGYEEVLPINTGAETVEATALIVIS